jgi:predicted secreted protein
MVFNAPFNSISVISWWSVSLVEETGVPGKKHQPVASHWQTLSYNVESSIPKEELFYRKCNFSLRLKFVVRYNLCGNDLGIVVVLYISEKVKIILTNFCEKGYRSIS